MNAPTAPGPSPRSSRPIPAIRDLDEAAKSMIRSGVRISGVSHAALELVHNAVDSGADDISVSVNLKSFKLQVGQHFSRNALRM